MLITAFGGGVLAAAIGAVPAFVMTGLTVLAAVFGGEFGSAIVNTISFGSFFGPHVAFAGAVAAAAYAKGRGLLEDGMDIITPLIKLKDPMTLLIGGAFGVIGFMIQYVLGTVIGATLIGNAGWTDTVALTVVLSAIIARLLFTKSGLTGVQPDGKKRSLFPDGKRLSLLVVVGLGIGIVGGGFTTSLGELAQAGQFATDLSVISGATTADTALLLFNNAGTIGFGLAAVVLIFACMGKPVEAFHHIILPACTTAMIVFKGTYNGILSILAAAVMGILAAVLGEFLGNTFNSYADSHIDPPAFTICILQLINFSLLAQCIAPTGIFA